MLSRKERRELRQTCDEKVIKCCLASLTINKDILPSLIAIVDVTSKLMNKCSLVFNCLLIHCCSYGREFPDFKADTLYRHCATIGNATLPKPLPIVAEIWNMYFVPARFPIVRRQTGDCQSITYACQKYKTNFFNMTLTIFDQRLKRYVQTWCKLNNITKDDGWLICKGIKGLNTDDVVYPAAGLTYVTRQRELLGINQGDVISETWKRAHVPNIIRYYYSMIRQLNDWGASSFSIAPVVSIRQIFASFDTSSLYFLFKALGLGDNITKKSFAENAAAHWRSVFDIDRLSAHEFTGIIDTDGVSVCIHFRVPKARAEVPLPAPDTKTCPVIAIDPGRSNMIYAVRKLPDGSIRTDKLSRKTYYKQSGINTAQRHSEKWNRPVKEVFNQLSENTTKTVDVSRWQQYIQIYVVNYGRLWIHFSQRKWARQRMHLYISKRKCLDKFFVSLTFKGSPKPVVAYGDAKFCSSAKHEQSVPTTALFKACQRHFKTIPEDEFRTTMMCCCCRKETSKVTKVKEGVYREVRGLRWCSSTKCRKFLNRDKNAALNILRAFTSNERPKDLSRNPLPKDPLRPKTIYIRDSCDNG